MLKCTICNDGWFWFDSRDKKIKITCHSKNLVTRVIFNIRNKDMAQILTEEEIEQINTSETCERFTQKLLVCDGCSKVITPTDDMEIQAGGFFHSACGDERQKVIDSFLDDDEKAFFENNEKKTSPDEWLQGLKTQDDFCLVSGNIISKSLKAVAFQITNLKQLWVPTSCINAGVIVDGGLWIKKWFLEKKLADIFK